MFICTFAGHSFVSSPIIPILLKEKIEDCITGIDEAEFFVGGRGEFDSMAASAVRAAKKRHGDKIIRLYLVEPYMRTGINRDKAEIERLYDGVIIPKELMGIHSKAAIVMRNRWMVEKADMLIAFVQRDFGGAYQTIKFAQKMGNIRIINLADLADIEPGGANAL